MEWEETDTVLKMGTGSVSEVITGSLGGTECHRTITSVWFDESVLHSDYWGVTSIVQRHSYRITVFKCDSCHVVLMFMSFRPHCLKDVTRWKTEREKGPDINGTYHCPVCLSGVRGEPSLRQDMRPRKRKQRGTRFKKSLTRLTWRTFRDPRVDIEGKHYRNNDSSLINNGPHCKFIRIIRQ